VLSIPIARYCSIKRLALIYFSYAQQDHKLNETSIARLVFSRKAAQNADNFSYWVVVMPMLSKLLFCLLLLFSIKITANDYGSIIISRVTNVYDGDTFRVDIDQWPALIGKNAPIRINNIDTPELRAKCPNEKRLALLAKTFTKNKLFYAEIVELRNLNRGKYFRITADVFIDGESLADSLLSAGFAKIYSGKNKKQSWCH